MRAKYPPKDDEQEQMRDAVLQLGRYIGRKNVWSYETCGCKLGKPPRADQKQHQTHQGLGGAAAFLCEHKYACTNEKLDQPGEECTYGDKIEFHGIYEGRIPY